MANDFPLSTVLNISVSQAGQGVGSYNTSNIGLFTEEVPAASFGTLGYSIYSSPTQVGIDFGTASKTYAMALQVFSQRPNILANGGYLVVMTTVAALQAIAFSGVAASGQFVLNYGGNASAAILFSDTAAQIQAKLRAVPGLTSVVVTGTLAAGLTLSLAGTYGVQPVLTVTGNTMQTSGAVAVTPTVTTSTAGETLLAAINRTMGLVQYFGILITQVLPQADLIAAATVVQTLNKILFHCSRASGDIAAGGMIDLVRTGGFDQTRCLFYGSSSDADCMSFASAYASRMLSVVFSGSNTTITMQLKDLIGVQPDPTLTATSLALAAAAGADVYVSMQGVAKTLTSGTNNYADRVYNRLWFVGALQVAVFNLYAQTPTKIPQTEDGAAALRGEIRQVCQQAVSNQYLAPGSWTSPNTFGDLSDFVANILQAGYYIYTAPVSQQSVADRAARKAPIAQVAAKEAGASHSATILINLNQ